MLLGYMRVSKADGSQVVDLQRDALVAAGVTTGHLYEDLASGRRDDRPGLASCVKALRQGDTLVIWKLDRLGRDLHHLVNLVHELTQRGVGLKVLAGEGGAIDTSTATGKLVFGIFASLAEFERALITERTKAGIAAARARGRKGGTPFRMSAAKLRLAQTAMGKALQTALALRRAIWRKEDAAWTVCGIPDVLYTDHGSDFISRHIEQVCAELKIRLVFSLPGQPRGRGRIERFFGTINTRCLAALPGYIAHDGGVPEPGISLIELGAVLRRFIIGEYHHTPHSATGEKPEAR
jgi:DNA invertase Pin-like site-specific DNA recombinase